MNKTICVVVLFSTLIFLSSLSFSQAVYAPDSSWYYPEAIWAAASYGGDWSTEVFIHDIQGGAQVRVIFYYGAGNSRGPFLLADNTGKGASVYKSTNILQDLQDHFDPVFAYYGKIGFLSIYNSQGKPMHVTCRNYHSNSYGKTMNAFPGNAIYYYAALPGSGIKIPNIMKGSAWRTTCVFMNITSNTATVRFRLIGKRDLELCGSINTIYPPSAVESTEFGTFDVVFAPMEYKAFDPFAMVGVSATGWCSLPPSPGNKTYHYDCYLDVEVISGSTYIIGYGSVAHNTTNDPAAMIPVKKTNY